MVFEESRQIRNGRTIVYPGECLNLIIIGTSFKDGNAIGQVFVSGVRGVSEYSCGKYLASLNVL